MRTPSRSTVHVVDRAKRGSGRHEVRAFDFHVRGGERDLVGALRVDGEIRDIPGAGSDRVRDFSRRIVRHELDRHADPPGELSGEVDGEAAKIARDRTALREDRVSIIDGRAERAGRREVGPDCGRDARRGRACHEQNDTDHRERDFEHHELLASSYSAWNPIRFYSG
jgi:hypothetical protein